MYIDVSSWRKARRRERTIRARGSTAAPVLVPANRNSSGSTQASELVSARRRYFDFPQFLRADRASVTAIAALALPVMLGFVALVAEFGHGLLIKAETQRVADEAAYAAALAYETTNSTATMLSVAQNVAVLNGLSASSVSASVVASSPRTAADSAIEVSVSTNETLLIAPVLHFGNKLNITVSAYAQIPGSPSSCVLALNQSGTGITLSGGTRITATTCAVASNNSVAVPCGDYITAEDLYYDGAAPTQGCGGITATIAHMLTPDPLAGNSGIQTAAARAVSDESLTAPTIAAVPSAPSITFDYSGSATSVAAAAGCAASFSSPTWTVTCPAGGTYKFGNLSLGGGITVKFNTGATATYDFSGEINNSGSSLTFGPGTFNIAQGLYTGGGSTTVFGAGTFNIGPMPSTCNGSGYYSICNTGTSLTFGGPSTFVITSGVNNGGGETITFGSGSTNSYDIGPASDGNALNFGGGSTTTFANATGSGDLFQIVGNLYESGGACTTLPAAPNQDINGNINLQGGLTLGSGLYAVSGYVAFGASSGGDVWCAGANANVGVSGVNVTFAIAGQSTPSSGNCAQMALCIGSGFNHVSLVAPTYGTYELIAVVGPLATSNTSGASMNEGASATDFGGALYFPNGPLTVTGGASIGNVSGQCFQIVASQITLSGGTSATASPCFGPAPTSSTPVLVQ
jgi:Flp pilus assembly protein TadG